MQQNNPTFSPSPYSSQDDSPHQFQTEKPKSSRLLQWWYRFSVFPEPSPSASIDDVDFFRRGQTLSQIILVLIVLMLFVMPIAITLIFTRGDAGVILLSILVIAIGLLLFCAWLNRVRQVTAASLLTIAVFTIGPLINVVTTPGGVDFTSLPAMYLLIFPIMIGASTLLRRYVPFIALINCICIVLSLTVLPQSTGLMRIPPDLLPEQLAPAIMSQVLVAVVSLAWVSGIGHALRRASQAEEVAQLQRDLSQQMFQDAERKKCLEESVELISVIHKRVANGDYQARVPLRSGNILWQVSGLLNNLLSRFQALLQRVTELERINKLQHAEIVRLTQTVGDLGYQLENARKMMASGGRSSDLSPSQLSPSLEAPKSQRPLQYQGEKF